VISSILRTFALGCLAVCALFLAGGISRGAQPYQPVLGDPMLEPWRWRAFPEMSGLDVLCVAESKDGTMWFGTANGLWSYDGFAWVRHTSGVGRLVTTLCSHPDGTLYAGGGWGISRFRNGGWNELLKTTGERIANLSDIPVKKLALAHDGTLWAAIPPGRFIPTGSEPNATGPSARSRLCTWNFFLTRC
jgi:ligand-binding sensor domain-containing protein